MYKHIVFGLTAAKVIHFFWCLWAFASELKSSCQAKGGIPEPKATNLNSKNSHCICSIFQSCGCTRNLLGHKDPKL